MILKNALLLFCKNLTPSFRYFLWFLAVWLNINLLVQMGTMNDACLQECLRLGLNQSDTDDLDVGCKLRPDEGLDAISSLSPGGIGSTLLVGGTNTVYSWLIQWLADNLGYDVTRLAVE
jgi:Lecithin:cholesterol acyltransferase